MKIAIPDMISNSYFPAIAADRAKLRSYLLRVAMIEGIRRANAIT